MADTEANVRRATLADRDLLVAMMCEFYRETASPCDPGEAAASFERVIGDHELGRVYVIESGAEPAGYFVMTLGFSMEFAGTSAFLDDLYLRPAFRGRGLGRAALATLRAECVATGAKVAYLEVAQDNTAAVGLYRDAGFVHRGLMLMVMPLEPRLDDRV